MNTATTRHRSLLDHETLVERTHTVSVIEYAMRGDDLWRQAGDGTRRQMAQRFAFVLWAIKHGVVSDGD